MAEPFVVVGAAVLDGDRVLVAQRSRPAYLAGLWEFPGGKVEAGEDEPRALLRECREELGVEVAVTDRLGPDVAVLGGRAVLRVWTATLAAGTPAPHDHAALRWVGVDDLDSLPWIPEDRVLLPALAALLRSRVPQGW